MNAFRSTALAAGLLAAFGALAAPVQITFDELGQQAFDAKAPIQVTTVQGINFSGAYAWRSDMATQLNDPRPVGNNTGFLANRGRGSSAGQLVISLEDISHALAVAGSGAGSSFPNQYFSHIDYSFFGGSLTVNPTLTWFDINGTELGHTDLVNGSGTIWSDGNVADFASQDKVSKLVFAAGGALMGIDNLNITLTDPGTGGNAPEPASYALVGAALLAAGAASRRRNR